jgi:hypothetical protein
VGVFGTIVTRAIIVLVVFPVIGHAIYTAMTWLLARMLLPMLTLAEAWSSTVDRGVLGVTILVAAAGSWSVCRRLWPASIARR